MRKMMVAGLLALALTATGQQKASAWCKFSWTCGFNMTYESTGTCWNWCLSCKPNPPPPCYNGCYPGSYGYSGYGYGYGYAAAPAAPAAAAAAPATTAPAAYQFQQVGYSFYGQGQAPSYWYGY
jgi:hypothetical protein